MLWNDVVVVSDNGRAAISRYDAVSNVISKNALRYGKVGILTIVPADASPPAEDVRSAMRAAMARVEDQIKCICWLVEATGFQGAMVRAVLTGLRALRKHPYPTHVTSEMGDALSWILRQLDGGPRRLAQVEASVTEIQTQRTLGPFEEI
jgi:hypothetical protein